MKGDPINLPSLPLGTTNQILFRRNKAERLDWRKIASLDTDQIIQDSDVETLQEILPEIAFCKAEVEFDHEKTDPGFRKVFQLAQLIIEYLLYNQSLTTEKSVAFEKKCTELTDANTKYIDELKSLKEKLFDAKKELKKRKEMLVTSQNEMMGENKDEYDQCPYCTKRFIASVYLFSHMQRRHQGLPLHPMFSTHSRAANNVIDFKSQQQQFQVSNKVFQDHSLTRRMSAQTQTSEHASYMDNNESGEIDADKGDNKYDMNTVNAIVEKYLQHNPSAGEAMENLLPLKEADKISSRRSSLEETERNIAKIKEDLESQWKNLAEKIHQTGVQELKSVLMTEMQKMQEIITSTASNTEVKTAQPQEIGNEPSSAKIMENVEERFLKQENELEILRQNLQNKMEGDLVSIEGKLESQERFWRSKLRQVEEEYHQQVSKLQDAFQASIMAPQLTVDTSILEKPSYPLQSTVVENVPQQDVPSPYLKKITHRRQTRSLTPSPARSIARSPQVKLNRHSISTYKSPESHLANITHKPPKSPRSNVNSPIKMHVSTKSHDLIILPVPKPRVNKIAPQHVNSVTPKVKAALIKINESPIAMQPSITAHEYEEPQDVHKSDQVSDYSSSEVTTPSEEKLTKRRIKKSIANQQHSMDNVTEKISQMKLIRTKVLEDVDKQMNELGLNPDGSQLENSDIKKALSTLRHRRKRREKVDQKFTTERMSVKEKVKFSAAAEEIKHNLEHPEMLKPKTAGTVSPLVKMFSAVKTQGNSWKKKVAISLSKRKSAQRTTDSQKEPKLKTFFRRASARWKKSSKTEEAEIEESEESETSSASSSDEPNVPMLTRSKPILVNQNRRRTSKGKRRNKEESLSEVNESSDPTSEQTPPKAMKSRVGVRTNNDRIPELLIKKPVERDLLKDFEAVQDGIKDTQNREPEITPVMSRDVSGDNSSISGTGTPETSDSDSKSSKKDDKKIGHYVSLRTPTRVDRTDKNELPNVNELVMPKSSTFTLSVKTNPRSPASVPVKNTSSFNTSRTKSDISPRKPESSLFSQNRSSILPEASNTSTSKWNTSSDDEQTGNIVQIRPRNTNNIMYPSSQKHSPTPNANAVSSQKRTGWTSTSMAAKPSVPNSKSIPPHRSPMDNSWDSDLEDE